MAPSASLLTMVVPTHNRYTFLLRLLRYYHACGAPFAMRLLDSSREPEPSDVRSLVRAMGVTHLRYDAAMPPTVKIAKGVSGVTTPFVVLWADDDLLVPSACGAAAHFLEGHPEVSVAHGEAGLFQMRRVGLHAMPDVGSYRQLSYTAATAAERVRHYLMEPSVIFYSIQRTAQFAENLERCLASGLAEAVHRSDWWVERILAALSLVRGKAQRLDRLYMMRERHAGVDSWEAERLDVFDWMTSASFANTYRIFSACLGEAVAKHDGLALDEARSLIKEAFWWHLYQGLARGWAGRYGNQRPARVSPAWRRAAARVPALRSTWRMVRSWLPSAALSVESLCRSSSPYHDDFMPIYRAITQEAG